MRNSYLLHAFCLNVMQLRRNIISLSACMKASCMFCIKARA